MTHRNALFSALILGTLLQLVMVLAGHYSAFVRNDLFALGGTAISLVAGLTYGWRAGGEWGERLTGGAIAGGACAFLGIAVSVVLKDTAPMILVIGTVSSAVTGAMGGAASRLLK